MNGLQNASVWDMAREKHLDKRSAALACLRKQDGLFGRGATVVSRSNSRKRQNAMQLSSWTAKVWAPNWVLPTTSHVDSTGRAPVCCSGCCLSFRKQSRSHLTEVLHVHAGEISQCLYNLQDVLGTLGFLAVSRRRRT